MAYEGRKYEAGDFSGGIDRRIQARAGNELVDMFNVVEAPRNGLQKRPGHREYNTVEADIEELLLGTRTVSGFCGCISYLYPDITGANIDPTKIRKSEITWAAKKSTGGAPTQTVNLVYSDPDVTPAGGSRLVEWTDPSVADTAPNFTVPGDTWMGHWTFGQFKPDLNMAATDRPLIFGCNGIDEPIKLDPHSHKIYPFHEDGIGPYWDHTASPAASVIDGGLAAYKWMTVYAADRNPHYCLCYQNRVLWFVDNVMYYTAGFPSIEDYTVGTVANRWEIIGPQDGERVVAACPGGVDAQGSQVLWIFKETRIFALVGVLADDGDSSGYAVKEVVTGLGCIAANTLKSVNGAAVFLTHKGVALYDGNHPALISGPVWMGVYGDDGLGLQEYNPAFAHKACAVVDDQSYRIALTPNGADENYNSMIYFTEINWPADITDYEKLIGIWRREEVNYLSGGELHPTGPECWCAVRNDTTEETRTFWGERDEGWIYQQKAHKPGSDSQQWDEIRGGTQDIHYWMWWFPIPPGELITVKKRFQTLVLIIKSLGETIIVEFFPQGAFQAGRGEEVLISSWSSSTWTFDNLLFGADGYLENREGIDYITGGAGTDSTRTGRFIRFPAKKNIGDAIGLRIKGYGQGSMLFSGFGVNYTRMEGRYR